MLMRLRVSLPDRPGALGQVARALGTLGADIHQVTVLSRETGRAVDDFTVSWPGPPGLAEVRDRLSAVPGVNVEGAWPTREVPGSAPDYDLLRHAVTDPARAFATMVDAVPDLVCADWAVTVAVGPGVPDVRSAVVHRSWRAPEALEMTGPMSPRPVIHSAGPAPMMTVPLGGTGLCLVVGRAGGLTFHRAELDKVARVAEIVTMVGRVGEGRASTESVVG